MTATPYLADPYRRTIEATVERSLDDRVVLDRTICYPEGGGQPADRGTLTLAEDGEGDGQTDREGRGAGDGAESAGWRIVDVQKRDTIYHHLEPVHTDDRADASDGSVSAPPEGATVAIELDWDRRYAHMRYHTAQHLLSRVLIDDNATTEGNQLYADGARIDCAKDRFSDAELAEVEDRVNALIEDDRPVEWYELDRAVAEERLDPERTRIELLPDSITEIRIVEIEEFDRTACAGTHVEATGECGRFELTGRESKGGDVERLRFELS
ncbi:alanyl-tRNA editing protein [Salinarchaeum laminariae]|uniref:alanyl-tRNA editing protein n=1 Tax=Salinarchaeum laminariae TaxID=869888 RepID=UPI0020C0D539|nr:alanyl-tRNA editing protein [Salinarchaeum laminariae]